MSYVTLNGSSYEFAARKPLKSVPTVAATVDGAATSVLVIDAKNFADVRVWLPTGRFLVPAAKWADLAGKPLVISTAAAPAVKYDREALRTRTEVRAKKVVTETAPV